MSIRLLLDVLVLDVSMRERSTAIALLELY
jgi:hypothetical protein